MGALVIAVSLMVYIEAPDILEAFIHHVLYTTCHILCIKY